MEDPAEPTPEAPLVKRFSLDNIFFILLKFLPRIGGYTKCPVVGIPVGIFCLFWSSWGDWPGTVVADDDDPTEVVWGVEALLRTMEDPAEPPPGTPLVKRFIFEQYFYFVEVASKKRRLHQVSSCGHSRGHLLLVLELLG